MQIDGVTTVVPAGEVLRIEKGQSICFEPYMYHQFWSEGGHSMIGEVSTVNDDENDNRFLEPLGRYPHIDEDAVPGNISKPGLSDISCDLGSPAEMKSWGETWGLSKECRSLCPHWPPSQEGLSPWPVSAKENFVMKASLQLIFSNNLPVN